jgi:hypothetical protein
MPVKYMMAIHEAQDWESIRDPAKKWLGRFTYTNQGKNPDKSILDTLIQDYPNKPGVIYRGMNFTREESYSEFMATFNNTNGKLTFNVVTSWSSNAGVAEQFALTQPTYQLNLAVMTAYDQQQKNRERLSGYRGVILKTTIARGVGIDVDASGVGHESEIVLPPGTYQTEIHQLIKQYQHSLEDGDTNIDEVILKTTPESLRSRTTEHSFFDYVIHHHGQELSPKAQRHLLKLFGPQPSVPLFKSEVDRSKNYFTKQPVVRFDYYIPTIRLFELAERNIFTPEVYRKIQALGKRIISEALPVLSEVVAEATYFNPAQLGLVSRVSGDRRAIDAIRLAIRGAVAKLDQSIKDINKIKDPRAKQEAITQYKEQMVSLLSRLGVK